MQTIYEDEQQTTKYIGGLKYPIQERTIFHDVFSFDNAHNIAMKIERLYIRASPFRRLMSIEELLGGKEIQPSFMIVDQPPT